MSLLDILLPRACRLCGRRLSDDENMVCDRCFHRLELLHLEACPEDNVMARLLWGHFTPERCVALMRYSQESFGSSLIHSLKYFGDYDIGVWLGYTSALVAMHKRLHAGSVRPARPLPDPTSLPPFFDGIDLIVPMPLHRRRLIHRGYNQSVAIAKGIQMATDIPIETSAVVRQLNTQTQTRLDAIGRRNNMEGAFLLKHPERITGRHLLIVDDVITTGATIAALGKELLKAHNVKLSVMTIAFATNRVLL